MQPFLVEREEEKHPNLLRLLKHYIFLNTASILVSVVGFSIFLYLTSELANTCNGPIGYKVTIPQLVSYFLQLLFSLACIAMIHKGRSLIPVQFLCFLTLCCKIAALVLTILYRDRNWGDCYISRVQGIILIVDESVEIGIIVILYVFSHKIFGKLKELELLAKVQLASILKI